MLHSRQLRLIFWLVILIGAVLPSAALRGANAASADDGTISGQVMMGSEGKTIEGPLTVNLVVYRDGQLQEALTTTTDSENTYTFANLTASAAYEYAPFVNYQGIDYFASLLTLAEAKRRTANITVYEPTEDQSVLRVLRHTIAITSADAEDKRLSVLEIVELENGSDRGYLSSATGTSGPMGLLRFGLPPGARDLQPLGPLAAFEIVSANVGFATNMPVPPGKTRVSFSYLIDYSGLRGTTFAYDTSLPYATDQVIVLIGDPRLSISSPALRNAGTASIRSQPYRLYDSVSQPVASTVPITINGLPGMFPFDLSGPTVRYAGLGLTITLAGLALIRGLADGRLSARPAASSIQAGTDLAHGRPDGLNGLTTAAAEESLLLETARLDLDFEWGRIPEDVYRRERAALKYRLVELLREPSGESEPVDAPRTVSS